MGSSVVYWSTLSSLYSNLSSEEIAALDNAVRLRFCGFYEEALELFVTKLALVRRSPVVAIELSVLHERRGSEVERCKVLQDALDYVEKGHSDVSESVHWLLRIMRASCDYYTNGQLRPALTIARGLQRWLGTFDAGEYTDIMVSQIALWHRLLASNSG